MSDSMVGIVSAVSVMFDMIEGDDAKSIEQRAKFYKTLSGIHWPDNWDTLDLAEKKRRLDGMDAIGLGRDDDE